MEIRSLDQIKVQIGLALKGLVEHVLIGLMEFLAALGIECMELGVGGVAGIEPRATDHDVY